MYIHGLNIESIVLRTYIYRIIEDEQDDKIFRNLLKKIINFFLA